MGPRPGGRGIRRLRDVLRRAGRLQWGRAPGGAELRSSRMTRTKSRSASMGPRPGGRGILATSCALSFPPSGFNGAAPRGARNSVGAHWVKSQRHGLQWGRAPGGAEFAVRFVEADSDPLLQWGRAPGGAEFRTAATLAETSVSFNGAAPRGARNSASPARHRTGLCRFNGAAPRGARNFRGDPLTSERGFASMGPRPGGRGIASCVNCSL